MRATLIRRRGLDLGHYKRSYVLRRVQVRARVLGLPDLDAYASYLERHTRETDEFLRTLSVRVTRFFRNPTFFHLLDRQVLRILLSGPSGRSGPALEVWSAGCATGEEAYSIAMLLASRDPDGSAKILATDMDRRAMLVARSAEYPRAASRHVPRHLADRFLAPVSRQRVRVAAEAARRVTFRLADIFEGPKRPLYDLIVCRNVLIYFEPEQQPELLCRFVSALRPGGFLALGRAERVTGPARNALVPFSAAERVYRRN
jgi:chemotaxis methyl-accepting protein methylase